MSVLLTPLTSDNSVHISNGEWAAIIAASRAFGIAVPKFESHDPEEYTPQILNEMAQRIEQLKHAPEWLRQLANEGGASLS